MARLRFPGRPGCRADRMGIPFFADDVTESVDPALSYISNLKRGNKKFKELCRESEREEFEGFTEEDARFSGKKLRAAVRAEHKLQGCHPSSGRGSESDHSSVSHTSHHKSSGLHSASSSHQKTQSVQGIFGPVSSPGELPPLSREEILRKALAAKELLASIKAKHKHALQGRVVQNKVGRPRKPWKPPGKVAEKVLPARSLPEAAADSSREPKSRLVSKRAERRSATYQTPKIRLGSKQTAPEHQVQKSTRTRVGVEEGRTPVSETEGQPVRAPADRSKTVVKQLLQKAKQGGSQSLAKVKGADDGLGEAASQKRNVHTFVLPQFSRSRRAIIPNKRFIEDDPIPSAVLIKRPRLDVVSQLASDSQPAEGKDREESSAGAVSTTPGKRSVKTPAQQSVIRKKAVRSVAGGASSEEPVLPSAHKRFPKSPPAAESPSTSPGLKRSRKLQKAKSALGSTKAGRKAGKWSSVEGSVSLPFETSKSSRAEVTARTGRSDETPRTCRAEVTPKASRSDATSNCNRTDAPSGASRRTETTPKGNSTEPERTDVTPTSRMSTREGNATSRSLSKIDTTPSSAYDSGTEEQQSPGGVPTAEQLLQLEMSPVVAVTPHKMDPSHAVPGSSDLLLTANTSSFRKGLLEQPLIVEGKRQRVPSLKVRLINRESEESAALSESEGSDLAVAGEEVRQNGSKKEKFTLFPKAPGSAPKKFSRAGPMKLQRRDKDGKESILTKRSGQIMLRKAKLQLNRTALNRSKAALARSLKAQLKREAKQKGKKSAPQRHSPRPGVTSPLSISVLGSGASHPFDSPNSQPSPLLAGLSPGSQGGFASPPRIVSSLSPISLPSKKEPGEGTAEKSRDSTKPVSRGPRIKHVCRRAAVVLPKPLATFPAPPEPSGSPTLSALPSPEKEKLLQSHPTANSDDDRDSSEEEKVKPKKKKVISSAKLKKLRLEAKYGRFRGKRKNRCKECKGCLTPNCGKCVYCLDSKKFGGKNILKQACIYRRCERPVYSKQATDAFIQPKVNNNNKGGGGGGGVKREGDEVDSSQVRQGPSRMARPAAGFFASMGGDSRGEDTHDEGEGGPQDRSSSPPPPTPRERSMRVAPALEGERGVMDEGGLEIMSAVGVQRHALTHHARRLLKRKEKTGLRVRLPMVVPEPQPMAATSALWSLSPNTRSVVHTELKENFDLDVAWSRGLALTLAAATCVRTVCFLCGSAGRHKLLYCSICCEPFHLFCLEAEDRPLEGCSVDNWCCRRCQFCHVCGLQTGLLQCDRCQDTYHPECLGPAYPKQPSRRNVWVCTKCVRCKSCGATTPGSGTNATWTYDFSLCFDCGKLMDKGNFCPVCRKCYTDDDWESKMVQCGLCDSWVHARCEGLTDEMYQLFSFLPEDIQYRCRVCCPDDPPEWRTILHDELLTGLRSVLLGLTSFKCSHHLMLIDEEKERERSQRAQHRKKPIPGPINSETLRTSPRLLPSDALRTSPRLPRHTRSSHSSPEERETPDVNTDMGSTPTNPASSPGSHNNGEPALPAGLSDHLPEKEESREVMEVSDSELSPAKTRAGSKSPQPCSDSSGCERGRPERTVKMSERSVLERLAQRKRGDSASSSDQLDSSMEVKPDVEFCLEEKASCEDSAKHELEGQSCVESPSGMKVGAAEGKGCSLNTSSTAPSVLSASSSAMPASSSVAMETTGGDRSSVGTSDRASHGVARNLFETFLASSRAGGSRDEESAPCEDRPGGRPGTSPAEWEEKDIKISVEDLKMSSPPSPGTAEVTDCSNPAQPPTHSSPQSDPHVTSEEGVPPSSGNSQNTPCPNVTSETADSSEIGEDSVCVKKDEEEQTESSGNAVEGSVTSCTQTEYSPRERGDHSGSGVEKGEQHVTFTVNMVTEATDNRSLVPRFQRQFPRDFNAVKMKLEADKYTSVEEFNEDMVHIIQTALSDDHLLPTRRKLNNSVKSIFIKQMERVFPWFNVKTCQLWQHNRVLPQGMLLDAVVPPNTDHTYAQWLERESTLSSPQLSAFKPLAALSSDAVQSMEMLDVCEDLRQCALCLEMGDAYPDDAGRLLYAGQDDWVHVNCALWSAEVFEEEDGTLQNVHVAMVRGRQLRCNRCQMQGATVGCCVQGCPANYHFLCARRQLCLFKEDKTVYCYEHREQASFQIENQKGFAVHRRVCVDMADIRCMKKSWARGLDATYVNILFGCCTVESLGSLAPLSDCKGCLLPLDFRCTRVYWSTVDARRRTVYTCRIVEVRPSPPTPEAVLRDVRVVHDERHPDYVPLDTLDLPSLGLAHLLPASDDVVCVSHTSPGRSLCRQHSREQGDEGSASITDSANQVEMRPGSSVSTDSRTLPMSGVEGGELLSVQGSASAQSASSQPPQGGERLPAAPSFPGIDYSRLSLRTLKLLNISDPRQIPAVTPTSSAASPAPSSPQPEFGNLMGMVQRLNSAAKRSRSGQSEAAALRGRRCSSVDGAVTGVPVPAARPQRSMSLSPVGFMSQVSPRLPTSPPVVPHPARCRSLSPSDTGRSSILWRGRSPSVTPIMEQCESEQPENPWRGHASRADRMRRKRGSSLPPRGEVFIDLTVDESGESSVPCGGKGLTPHRDRFRRVDTVAGKKRPRNDAHQVDDGVCEEIVHLDTDPEEAGEVDGDVVLARQVLQSVPKEILESSEVKVLVVPDDVSEEEALQLAEEALHHSSQQEEDQRPLQSGDISMEDTDPSGPRLPEEGGERREDRTQTAPEGSDGLTEKNGSAAAVESSSELCPGDGGDHTLSGTAGGPLVRTADCGADGCGSAFQRPRKDDCQESTGRGCALTLPPYEGEEGHSLKDCPQKTHKMPQGPHSAGHKALAVDQQPSSSTAPPVSSQEKPSSLQPPGVSQAEETRITSSLKMAEALSIAMVYDRKGNVIGQRTHRPYVVETVQKKGDSLNIEFQRAVERGILGSGKMPLEHFRVALNTSAPRENSAESEHEQGDRTVSHDPAQSPGSVGVWDKPGEEDCGAGKDEDVPAVTDRSGCTEERVADLERVAEDHPGLTGSQNHQSAQHVLGGATAIGRAGPSQRVSEQSEGLPGSSKTVRARHSSCPQSRGVRPDAQLSRISPRIKLPDDVDSRKLHCSVSVHKLPLTDLSSPVSVRDMSRHRCMERCFVRDLSQRGAAGAPLDSQDGDSAGDCSLTGAEGIVTAGGSAGESDSTAVGSATVSDRSAGGSDTVSDRSVEVSGTTSDRSAGESDTISDISAVGSDKVSERSAERSATTSDRSAGGSDTISDISAVGSDTVSERSATTSDRSAGGSNTVSERSAGGSDTVSERSAGGSDTTSDRSAGRSDTVSGGSATISERSATVSGSITEKSPTKSDRSAVGSDTVSGSITEGSATTSDRSAVGSDALSGSITEGSATPPGSQSVAAEREAGSSLAGVPVKALERSLLEADLCHKLGLACAGSPEASCLQSLMVSGAKRACNGADKEGSPQPPVLCPKDMVRMALNPPSSVTHHISHALRTVECRVSLERLSGGGPRRRDAAAGSTSPPPGSNHSNDGFPIGSQRPSSADSSKAVSGGTRGQAGDCGDLDRGLDGGSDEASTPGSLQALKVGDSCPSFNQSFVEFLGKLESANQNVSPGEGKVTHARLNKEEGDNMAEPKEGCVSNPERENPAQPVASVRERDPSPQTESDSGRTDIDSLPLHTELALRIKAESLARSSPGESGPFKCPTCKRLYRTVHSFSAHAQSCDFDLSTSDEEEEGDDDKRDGEKDGGKDGAKQSLRTSLRQSTLTQRKAMESSQLQMAQQAAEKTTSLTTAKGSSKQAPAAEKGTPVTPEKTHCPSDDASPHRSRGRPKRLSGSDSRESQSSEHTPEPARRGRGRPRKMSGQPARADSVGVEEKPAEQLSPKESLLGAVGLVSKNCLEMQAAALNSARAASSPQAEGQGQRQAAQPLSSGRQSRARQTQPEKSGREEMVLSTADLMDPAVSLSLVSSQQSKKSASECSMLSETSSTQDDDPASSLAGEDKAEVMDTCSETFPEQQQVSAESVDKSLSERPGTDTPDPEGLSSQKKTSADMEDSDHDSDVIIIGEDPVSTVGTSARKRDSLQAVSEPQGSARSSVGKGVSEGQAVSRPVTTVKDGQERAETADQQKAGTGREIHTARGSTLEKHRTVTPILSRLVSSLTSAAETKPSPSKVAGRTEQRSLPVKDTNRTEARSAHDPASSQADRSLLRTALGRPDQLDDAASASSGMRPLHISVLHPAHVPRTGPSSVTDNTEGRPVTVTATHNTTNLPGSSVWASSSSPVAQAASGAVVATTSLSATASCSPNYSSRSSLLLSSTNVQADIDSDDLSFTDSEDDDSRVEGSPPPLPVSSVSDQRAASVGVPHVGIPAASHSLRASAPSAGAYSLSSSFSVTGATSVTSVTESGVTSGRVVSSCPGLSATLSVPSRAVSTPTPAPSVHQSSASHLLTMLDKLSHDQKVILTQQLVQKGTLSIDSPIMPPQHTLTLSQNAAGPSPSSVVLGRGGQTGSDRGQSSYGVGAIPASLVPGASALRIVNTGSGMSTAPLTFVPQQQDSMVMRATAVAPGLLTQQTAQGSVQILQHRPSIVVQHPVLPVASVTSLPPFATSPAGMASPLLSSLPVSTPSSLSTGLLSIQGQASPALLSARAQAPSTVLAPQPPVLCQPATVLNSLAPQTLVPAPMPGVGYMGSFLVDPNKSSSAGSDKKARLQLLSLIQGAMATCPPTSPPSTFVSSMAGVSQGTVVQSTRGVSPAPRVIRVVVDKPAHHSEHALAGGAPSQSVVRIMQVTPTASRTSTPIVSQSLSPSPALLPPSSLPSVHPASFLDSSGRTRVAEASLPETLASTMLAGKRQAYELPPALPAAKRPKVLSVERNGLVQVKDSMQLLVERERMTSAGSTLPAVTPGGAGCSSSSAGCQTSYKIGSTAGPEAPKAGPSNFRSLLKNKITARARKQNLAAVCKDAEAVTQTGTFAVPAKVKARGRVKAKADGVAIKKKVTRRKGGPLSHPIVHLSHQAGAVLPQAEVEEEIRETPLRQNPIMPPSQRPQEGAGAWPKDMPRLAFEISSEDGFCCRADTMEEAWRRVTDKVQDARAAARMKQMSYGGVNGVQMFGVGHDAVVYLVEQLAGAANCRQYKFRYHQYEPPDDEALLVNPSGSARCSAFATRKPYDIFSFLMSRHRHRPTLKDNSSKEEEMEHKSSRRATSMELPMAMRFRKLQEHAKEAVGVYRSRIHGRGLFCKRNIDNGEMVIEYSGEIIRSSLTDKREKYYESKGIGCYMFRIDDCEVVDATMHGSAARFINHSCEPNCYSKVISVDGKKHIVIFASRAIKKGEELTYDYKFPIEDVKIPCTCGSRKCRKYLN